MFDFEHLEHLRKDGNGGIDFDVFFSSYSAWMLIMLLDVFWMFVTMWTFVTRRCDTGEAFGVYAVSDVHTDKRDNMDLLQSWPKRPKDVLLLAGAVEDKQPTRNHPAVQAMFRTTCRSWERPSNCCWSVRGRRTWRTSSFLRLKHVELPKFSSQKWPMTKRWTWWPDIF